MKINWNDLAIAYLILLIWFSVSGAIFLLIPNIPSILWTFTVLALPLAFYFWRNNCSVMNAGIVSFILGVASLLLPFLWNILYEFMIVTFSDTVIHSPTMGLFDITTFIIQLILIGLSGMISGLIVWFTINKFLKRSTSK